MEKYNENYVLQFLRSRGWELIRTGKLFHYFKPPLDSNLPENFILEIPKYESQVSFNNYLDRILLTILEISPDVEGIDELRIFFAKDESVLKYRIFDSDTNDGSIQFEKHLESLDALMKTLKQSVTFVVSGKPIFGEAKYEVEKYLSRCRSLQTERGSYISKIELPNDTIYTSVGEYNSKEVADKFFDVMEFVSDQIFNTKTKINIDENYIQDNIEYVNYELLSSIRNIYSKPKINNIEYNLSSIHSYRNIVTERVQPRISYFNDYLKKLKTTLLDVVKLEAIGHVKKLTSVAPLHSTHNEVIIDAEISNNKEIIKVILQSEQYLEAIEAHKNELSIRIVGKARQGKSMLTIYELELFEVLGKR